MESAGAQVISAGKERLQKSSHEYRAHTGAPGCAAVRRSPGNALAICLLLVQMVSGCDSGVSELSGTAEKGPFLPGTPVTFYRLDDTAGRTQYTTPRRRNNVTGFINEYGKFSLSLPWRAVTEIEIEGMYFDELTGATASVPITLSTIIKFSGNSKANVHLFTHLAAGRIRELMAGGNSYEIAAALARREIQALFFLDLLNDARLEMLELVDGEGLHAADNANLLLFSSALLYADISQEQLDTMRTDFARDGTLDGAGADHWLRIRLAASLVDMSSVHQNLLTLNTGMAPPSMASMGNQLPGWVITGDSDLDTLSDAAEVFITLTDPNNADSDFDGMPDGWETENSLDPLMDDKDLDPDADNLFNLDEYLNNTDPQVSDSDADGMPDGWEVANGFDPLADDSELDTDQDGLNTLEEFQLGTDPNREDTDTDGYLDGYEVITGGDPLDAAVLPLYITSVPQTTAESGFAYAYMLATTWNGITYALVDGPAGMAVDEDSGLLSWLPAFGTEGNHGIVVSASANGFTVTQDFTLIVTAGNNGDVNEDGAVDAQDVFLVEQMALGMRSPNASQQVRGDLYPDGQINHSDTLLLERKVLGL